MSVETEILKDHPDTVFSYPEPEPEPVKPAAKLKEEAPTKRKLSATDKKLADDLTQIYVAVGLSINGIGSLKEDAGIALTGQRFVEKAESLSQNWLELANTNPAVKAALKKITQGSALGSLIVGHAVCVLPFVADRGIIPPQVAMAFAPTSPE